MITRLLPFIFILGCQSVQDKNIPVEQNGFITIEAEDYTHQEKDETRRWYRVDTKITPDVQPDPDENHAATASNLAYLEILPDTRVTHDDPLIVGENFTNEPGLMSVLSYDIEFTTPGRYHVWVRAFSTGTEDNGIHVGLNGQWPESGQRMQWCEGKNEWTWASKQRTDANHCGEPYLIFLDIPAAGMHTVQFSMREDGFEFDKFILTTDRDFVPD
jgi:hypothetical protein